MRHQSQERISSLYSSSCLQTVVCKGDARFLLDHSLYAGVRHMIKMGQVSSCLRSAGGAFGTLWGCAPSKAVTGRDRERYRQLRTSASSYTYTEGALLWESCSVHLSMKPY